MNEMLQEAWREVKGLPTEQLRKEFADGLRLSVERLTRLAVTLRELENRGETVEGVSRSMLRLLHRIADGELMAEVVVRFADRPLEMARVGALDPGRQKAVLDGELDAKTLPNVFKYQRRRPPPKRVPADDEDEEVRMPSFFGAAAKGTPKDVAAMCLRLVRESGDPAAVAAEMLPELQRLKNAPRPKPARVSLAE